VKARRDIHQKIAALAAAQHGVISRKQLVALGMTRGAIANALHAKRLLRLHRGVYAVGHAALQPDGPRTPSSWSSSICGRSSGCSPTTPASRAHPCSARC
jgi:hypothetical protein